MGRRGSKYIFLYNKTWNTTDRDVFTQNGVRTKVNATGVDNKAEYYFFGRLYSGNPNRPLGNSFSSYDPNKPQISLLNVIPISESATSSSVSNNIGGAATGPRICPGVNIVQCLSDHISTNGFDNIGLPILGGSGAIPIPDFNTRDISCVNNLDCNNGEVCNITTGRCVDDGAVLPPDGGGSGSGGSGSGRSGSGRSGRSGGGSGGFNAFCSTNSDCIAGLVCNNNICVTPLSCSDISRGYICSSGICLSGSTSTITRESNCCVGGCSSETIINQGVNRNGIRFDRKCIDEGISQVSVIDLDRSSSDNLLDKSKLELIGINQTTNPYTEQDYGCGGVQIAPSQDGQPVPGYGLLSILLTAGLLFFFYSRRK